MNSEPHLRAWVDESGSDWARDPGTYVLAAAIGRVEAEPDIREEITSLCLPGQVKLHWRDEGNKRRSMITHAVAELDLEHLVLVRVGVVDDRPERRRRRCLERLFYQLEVKAVNNVVLSLAALPMTDETFRCSTHCVAGITCPPGCGLPMLSAAVNRCFGSRTQSVGPLPAPAPATQATRPSSTLGSP